MRHVEKGVISRGGRGRRWLSGSRGACVTTPRIQARWTRTLDGRAGGGTAPGGGAGIASGRAGPETGTAGLAFGLGLIWKGFWPFCFLTMRNWAGGEQTPNCILEK